MRSGKIEDYLKENILNDILKNKGIKPRKSNPLFVALAIIGGFTVAFALIYSVYNLVSGNAYKDVDEEEDEFEDEDNASD